MMSVLDFCSDLYFICFLCLRGWLVRLSLSMAWDLGGEGNGAYGRGLLFLLLCLFLVTIFTFFALVSFSIFPLATQMSYDRFGS